MLFGRTKTIVGLDIGSYGVRAVELARSGDSLVLTTFGKAKIEAPEALEDTIRDVIRESGIHTKRCVTAVSGRTVIVRYVNMMPLPDDELRQAIRFEADKTLPFKVEEFVLDCQKIEQPMPGEQIRVVFVAANRQMIEDHVAMLDRLGLSPAVVDVDALALGNAFEVRCRRLGVSDEEFKGLVDIGASKTSINIIKGTSSWFARESYVAGNDLVYAVAKRFGEEEARVQALLEEPGGAIDTIKAEMKREVLKDICNEIGMSFRHLENQTGMLVREIYLSGGSVLFPDMESMVESVLGENPDTRENMIKAHIWDPMEALDITSSGLDAGRLEGMNSDMAIAVGLATRLREV